VRTVFRASPGGGRTTSAGLVEVFRQEAEHGPWDQGYPKVLGQGFGASGYFVWLMWNGGTDYLFSVSTLPVITDAVIHRL
jgi:hypothetical protein